MIHRITLRSNPRLLFFWLFIIVVSLGGIVLFLSLRGIGGVIALLGAGFVTYQFVKFIIPHLRSRIETTAQGITCVRPGSTDIAFRWQEITHAGLVSQPSHKLSIFLYNEEEDQLALIPEEFSDFQELLMTVKDHTSVQDIRLEKTDSIQEWLRRQLHVEPDDSDDFEELDESESS